MWYTLGRDRPKGSCGSLTIGERTNSTNIFNPSALNFRLV